MAAVTLVVPCFDEEQRLDAGAYRRAVDAHEGLRLVLVDDGSRDGTRRALDALAAGRPSAIEVLGLGTNRGKAEAVRLGIRHALRARPAAFGYWDADLATPFDALPDFVRVLDERPACLLVTGARVQLLGRVIRRSAARHYLGRVCATFISRALDLPVYDTQCGAKLFRNTPTTAGLFDEPFLARWAFDVEILARLGRALATEGTTGLEDVVYELPLDRWVDVGPSKVRGRAYLLAARDLWRIRRRYRPGRP